MLAADEARLQNLLGEWTHRESLAAEARASILEELRDLSTAAGGIGSSAAARVEEENDDEEVEDRSC